MAEIIKFEWGRQIFHISLGIFIVILLLYKLIDEKIVLTTAITGLIFSYLSRKIRIPVVYQLLQKFERKDDIKKFPGKGIIFYFTGVYISLLFFPKDIAMASIMVLAMGDSISHLFGIHYGKTKHPLSKIKFLEGTVAGFAAGFLGALVFLPWHEAFFSSLAAMIFEAVEIKVGTKQIDDNLTVPFVAGAAVWVIRLL